jgi:hypothetical protein
MTFVCSFLIADILALFSAGFENDVRHLVIVILPFSRLLHS